MSLEVALNSQPGTSIRALRAQSMLPIFMIVAVDFMGLGLILPLMPFYSEHNGASALTVGALISVYALCQFLAGPILGRLSDRYGRKPILLLSQVGSFAGYILFALSNTLWLIFIARIIDGLTAGNMSVAQAYVSDNSSIANRTKAFGVTSAAFGVGTMIGPAIGGLLATKSIHAPIWIAAGLSGLTILCTARFLPEGRPVLSDGPESETRPVRATLAAIKETETRRLTWMMICFYFALSMYMSGQALFLAGRFAWGGHPFDIENIGLIFAFVAAVNIVVQTVLMKRLTVWISEESMMTLGFLLMACGFVGIGLSHGLIALVSFLAVSNVGGSILRPVVVSQLSKRVTASRQGLVMGINQSIYALSAIAAPLVGGALINRSLYLAWALIIAAIACVGFFSAFWLKAPSQAANRFDDLQSAKPEAHDEIASRPRRLSLLSVNSEAQCIGEL
jgi:multidrug resistance protein